jgi:hypothetical protein
MKRLLIVLAVVAFGAAALYGVGLAIVFYGLTRSDPYPAFLSDFAKSRPHMYEDIRRDFSDYVVTRFPVGSDEHDATAQFVAGGFRIVKSTPETVELFWKRRAGPCSEEHLVIMSRTLAGKIANIAGRFSAICL